MCKIVSSTIVRSATASCLVAILFLGALGDGRSVRLAPLTESELLKYAGTGFWSDPCTWDGVLFGAGVVLCGLGNLGGCVSAAIGILKAWKLDNCF